MRPNLFTAMARFALALALVSSISMANAVNPVYIKGNGSDGVERELDVSRTPSLYTGDFADCLGGESLFNVTKFDAAYYADNLTVLFHLDGTTNMHKESLVLHLALEAYGELQFNMTYDPCKYNISSMCPLMAGVPVSAFAVFSIPPNATDGVSTVSMNMPDLESLARIQIFANSTETEIGCFQAVMTNGKTFSQPKAVGTAVGVMTTLALAASFATAIYGVSIPHMRQHYAHSFSVLIIFETFQSMFFSGALSVNWPSVLPAWWSNFAWTAGMIANNQLVRAVSSFTGNSVNITQVGGAGSVQINNGGGLSQMIYGRELTAAHGKLVDASLRKFVTRASHNATDPYDYSWSGSPRLPGMPMPGTWPGFTGTLSVVNIPPAEAFMVCVIWLLIAVVGVTVLVIVTKVVLDTLVKTKVLKTDGFDFFRKHVWGYIAVAILRTMYIAFFTIMTLSMYQLTLRGPTGPTAIAAIVWLLFFGGLGSIAAYACYFRLRHGKFEIGKDTIRLESGKMLGTVPFIAATRASKIGEEEPAHRPRLFGTMPVRKVTFVDEDADRATVHQDEGYIKRFGWLYGRYRRSNWWFFAVYMTYQFVRACFLGGGARMPLAQVYGLFVFEILALVLMVKVNPFESNRNAAVSVWMLSISKVVTTGFSIAFLPAFNLNRVAAAILGIIIVVVQCFIGIAVMILIVLGMISSCMSLSRNREQFPEPLEPFRVAFFEHARSRGDDLLKREEIAKGKEGAETELKGQNFELKPVRRATKIYGEGEGVITAFPDLEPPNAAGAGVPMGGQRSRANSASSRYSAGSLPRGARVHRASWSSKDLALWDAEMNRGDQQRLSHRRSRSGSLRMQSLNAELQGAATAARRPMTPTQETHEEPTPSKPDFPKEGHDVTSINTGVADGLNSNKSRTAAATGESPSESKVISARTEGLEEVESKDANVAESRAVENADEATSEGTKLQGGLNEFTTLCIQAHGHRQGAPV